MLSFNSLAELFFENWANDSIQKTFKICSGAFAKFLRTPKFQFRSQGPSPCGHGVEEHGKGRRPGPCIWLHHRVICPINGYASPLPYLLTRL